MPTHPVRPVDGRPPSAREGSAQREHDTEPHAWPHPDRSMFGRDTCSHGVEWSGRCDQCLSVGVLPPRPPGFIGRLLDRLLGW